MLGNQAFGPYGSTQYQSGNIGTAKGFTGQYQDPSGLDYDNARYYDPVVGLFISADTVQSNQQGMNPYAYVGGNPETDTDPTGQRVLAPNGSTSWTNPGTNTTYVSSRTGTVTTSGYTQSGEGLAGGEANHAPRADIWDTLKYYVEHDVENPAQAAGILEQGSNIEMCMKHIHLM